MTSSMLPEAEFAVNQCTRFSAEPKLPHYQDVKYILKHLKGTATQGIILKLDPEKGIKCSVDAEFSGGWNQEEGKDPGSFLSRMDYEINFADYTIIWEIWLQTEITLSTKDVEYATLLQAMRYALPFVSLMKEIEFVLELQGDTLNVLCSIS